MLRIFLLIWLGALSTLMAGAEPPVNQGWSQDLLEKLIASPVVTSTSNPSTNAPKEGLVLRSYQLRILHLGDPGRGTNVVNILRRMLPAESQVTEDRAANTVHVLTDRSAQEAVLELISAMDSESAANPLSNEAGVVPDDVRKALETLAATQPDSKRLIQLVEESSQRLEDRVNDTVRLSEAEAKANLHRELVRFSGIAGTVVLVLGTTTIILLRRAKTREEAKRIQRDDRSLTLLPAQGLELLTTATRDHQERGKELQKLMESFSIAYQADRQRGSVMLEAVTKKHGEISATLEQMQRLRHEIGENAGRVFLDVNREAIEQIIDQASRTLQTRAQEVGLIAETASRKMEETAGRLEIQHAKAEALTAELERTQREVDALFEKLREAQEQARRAELEAMEQRRIAYEKAAELTKKEAALAGLSLLMQEPMSAILDTINNQEIPLAETVPFPIGNPADRRFGGDEPNGFAVAETSSADEETDKSNNLVCPPSPLTFRILPVQ